MGCRVGSTPAEFPSCPGGPGQGANNEQSAWRKKLNPYRPWQLPPPPNQVCPEQKGSGMLTIGREKYMETVQSHYGLVLNALRDRNEMEQTLLGMGKSLQDKDTEISALKSSLQLLRESLDQLTVQQNEQHLKLCEQLGYMQLPSLLSEFQTFISAPRVLSHLKDRESQTSPNMLLTQLPSSPHLSLLNIPAGSKVIATISSTPDKENVGTPQRSHIIAGCPDADNVLCTLFANEAAGSHEACWLLTQEPCQATPVRKVIKRDKQVKGRNAVRLSQLNWAHKDSMFMQKHSGDQMNEKLGTDRKKQSKGRGSRIKKREQKLGSQRKKPYSFRKDGNRSRYTNLSMLQNSTGKGSSKSEKSKHSYRNTKNPDNSCLGTMFVNHKKMCCPENKIAEKPKLVFQSHENKQYTPNLQETSGVRKMVDLSSTKNNSSFWACSSPESSLSQNQMRWYSLFDNHSPACSISVQQKCTTYCSLLLDSDSSD
ncbi:Interactor of HORMAD1 protein 1 [Varanus komodoensis]|nr:Interactor of HORMAD1 protein 1 [Varanus komodoensis]